jgi:hypothetical protein
MATSIGAIGLASSSFYSDNVSVFLLEINLNLNLMLLSMFILIIIINILVAYNWFSSRIF